MRQFPIEGRLLYLTDYSVVNTHQLKQIDRMGIT